MSFQSNSVFKGGRIWSGRNGSWRAGKVVARGLLKPQGMRLKCSEKGLFTVSNSCPGLRQKRQIEAFSSLFFFFPYGCGDRTLCPPAFPHQRSSSGPNSGLDHCEHAKTRGRLWCGGGSRPSVCPSGVSSVFWVRSCFFFSPPCAISTCFSAGAKCCWTGQCQLLFSGCWPPLAEFVEFCGDCFCFLSRFRV